MLNVGSSMFEVQSFRSLDHILTMSGLWLCQRGQDPEKMSHLKDLPLRIDPLMPHRQGRSSHPEDFQTKFRPLYHYQGLLLQGHTHSRISCIRTYPFFSLLSKESRPKGPDFEFTPEGCSHPLTLFGFAARFVYRLSVALFFNVTRRTNPDTSCATASVDRKPKKPKKMAEPINSDPAQRTGFFRTK